MPEENETGGPHWSIKFHRKARSRYNKKDKTIVVECVLYRASNIDAKLVKVRKLSDFRIDKTNDESTRGLFWDIVYSELNANPEISVDYKERLYEQIARRVPRPSEWPPAQSGLRRVAADRLEKPEGTRPLQLGAEALKILRRNTGENK